MGLCDRVVRLGGVNQAGRPCRCWGSDTKRPAPGRDGGQTENGPRPVRGWCSCRWWRLQAADVAIAQGVVDQADQVAGGGGDADVAAAALPDLVSALAGAAVFAGALRGLDRGSPDEGAALFGDPAAVHGGVGLVMFRGQPGQVTDRNRDAVGGQDGVHLLAQAGPQMDQFGAVPDQLPQFPRRGRRDPALG